MQPRYGAGRCHTFHGGRCVVSNRGARRYYRKPFGVQIYCLLLPSFLLPSRPTGNQPRRIESQRVPFHATWLLQEHGFVLISTASILILETTDSTILKASSRQRPSNLDASQTLTGSGKATTVYDALTNAHGRRHALKGTSHTCALKNSSCRAD